MLGAEQLPVRVYTTADGLPSDDIHRIVRDSRGELWFCTQEGLAHFDGNRFVNYGVDQGLPAGLTFNVTETRTGAFWVSVHWGLLEFLPSGPQRFVTHALGDDGKPKSVRVVLEDRSGTLWVGAFEGLFRSHSGKFDSVDIGMSDARYADQHVTSLLEDPDGVLWIGARSGLYRRFPDGRVDHYTHQDGLPHDNVEALLRDRTGRLWVATRDGIWVWEGGRRYVLKMRDGLPGHSVYALLETTDGRVFAGIQGGVAEIGGREVVAWRKENGLPNWNCITLAEDPAGNLWVGTGAGAAKIARSGFRTYTQADGLSSPSVVAVTASRRGELTVAARKENEFYVHNFDGRRFHPIRLHFPPSVKVGWADNQILFQSRDSGWWVATGSGLCRFPNLEHVKDFAGTAPEAVYGARDGLAGDGITAIFEDSTGTLWVQATSPSAQGVYRFPKTTGRFELIPRERMGVRDHIGAQAFVEDASGGVWLGFASSDLVRYRDGRFLHFGRDDGLPRGPLESLLCDRAGRLWVATAQGGLGRIDDPSADHPSFRRYSTKEGLSSNIVSALAEDREGRIFAATGRGIDRIDPKTGGIRHYTAADGIGCGEVVSASADANGTLWFAGEDGLCRLDPEPREASAPPLAARITSVRVQGRARGLSEFGSDRVALGDLSPDQNQLEISFAAAHFRAGEVVQYRYRIDGDWSAPSPDRDLSFARLAPGAYRFEVEAVSADAASGTEPAQVTFTVLAPFYRRAWFVALLCSALAVLIYAAHLYRMRQVLAVERIRTRIASDLHDDIGSNLSRITMLSESARRAVERGGETDRALDKVAGVSRETLQAMNDIVWAINPSHDRLSDLVSRMRRFAVDLLAGEEIELNFSAPLAEPDTGLTVELRRQVYLIYKETLHNVLRHSGADRVDIRAEVAHGRLRLEVKDNGHGFDPDSGSNGHGLSSLQSRAASLGGNLRITTGAAGTRVELEVPLRGSTTSASSAAAGSAR